VCARDTVSLDSTTLAAATTTKESIDTGCSVVHSVAIQTVARGTRRRVLVRVPPLALKQPRQRQLIA
jgi:hypothetical protein